MLNPENRMNLALIWPILGARHEFGPHWIMPDIIPFLRIAFIPPQQMVKKARLPEALQFYARNCGWRMAKFSQRAPQALL